MIGLINLGRSFSAYFRGFDQFDEVLSHNFCVLNILKTETDWNMNKHATRVSRQKLFY